jgi:hypothetical protein
MTMIANNGFRTRRDIMMQVRLIDMAGKSRSLGQQFFEIGPTLAKSYLPIGRAVDAMRKKEGIFLSLRLLDTAKRIVSDNLYWLPDSAGKYSGLQRMGTAALIAEAHRIKSGDPGKNRVLVTMHNPAGGPIAFFNRLSLVDPATHKRLLPVFYSDNYVSLLPGESRSIVLDYDAGSHVSPLLSIRGWNVPEKFVNLR